MIPSWVLNIIRHLVFIGDPKGTMILTTTHMHASLTVSFTTRIENAQPEPPKTSPDAEGPDKPYQA